MQLGEFGLFVGVYFVMETYTQVYMRVYMEKGNLSFRVLVNSHCCSII